MRRHIELEEAIEMICGRVGRVSETVRLPLTEADGAVLAKEIRAAFDQPPFARSPLDGYALLAADTTGASPESPVRLRVIDKIMAGTASELTVTPGSAVRLMTGAPIPQGADCVIRQEETDYALKTSAGGIAKSIVKSAGRGTPALHSGADIGGLQKGAEPADAPYGIVEIYAALHAHDNICDAGEDFQKGALLAAEGEKLDYKSMALLASAGITEVTVYRRLKAAVLTSGDELMNPGEPLKPGKIYNSNLALVSTRLKEWGLEVLAQQAVIDEPERMAADIEALIDAADIVITTGGVSVGEKDIMHEALELLGAERLFWGVSIKPGAPTIAAICRGKPLLCLTGNPYGVLVNLELLAGNILARMGRDASIAPAGRVAAVQNDYPKTGGVRRLVRAHYDDGTVFIPEKGQLSGVLSSLRGCNCLADIAAETQGLKKGDQVWVWML